MRTVPLPWSERDMCAADALWVRHDELCRGACGRRMDGWSGPV